MCTFFDSPGKSLNSTWVKKKDQYKDHSGLFTSGRNPRKQSRGETEQDEATPTMSGPTHLFQLIPK